VAEQDVEIAAFLAKYPARTQEIAAALRRLIFATLPQPQERLDASSKMIGYGYGTRYADMVCTLIPSKTGLKLGLAYGATLADPHRLLGGTGKVHRHLNFETPADLKRAGVTKLLKAALAAQKARTSPP